MRAGFEGFAALSTVIVFFAAATAEKNGDSFGQHLILKLKEANQEFEGEPFAEFIEELEKPFDVDFKAREKRLKPIQAKIRQRIGKERCDKILFSLANKATLETFDRPLTASALILIARGFMREYEAPKQVEPRAYGFDQSAAYAHSLRKQRRNFMSKLALALGVGAFAASPVRWTLEATQPPKKGQGYQSGDLAIKKNLPGLHMARNVATVAIGAATTRYIDSQTFSKNNRFDKEAYYNLIRDSLAEGQVIELKRSPFPQTMAEFRKMLPDDYLSGEKMFYLTLTNSKMKDEIDGVQRELIAGTMSMLPKALRWKAFQDNIINVPHSLHRYFTENDGKRNWQGCGIYRCYQDGSRVDIRPTRVYLQGPEYLKIEPFEAETK